METIDRAGRISTDRGWSDEPCPGTYGATRAAGAGGPHSRPQAARSIYTARPRWSESTRGARSAYAIRPPPQRNEVFGTDRSALPALPQGDQIHPSYKIASELVGREHRRSD